MLFQHECSTMLRWVLCWCDLASIVVCLINEGLNCSLCVAVYNAGIVQYSLFKCDFITFILNSGHFGVHLIREICSRRLVNHHWLSFINKSHQRHQRKNHHVHICGPTTPNSYFMDDNFLLSATHPYVGAPFVPRLCPIYHLVKASQASAGASCVFGWALSNHLEEWEVMRSYGGYLCHISKAPELLLSLPSTFKPA